MQLNLWNEIIPNSDEWYTFPNTIRALIKYLPKEKIIWCPFDTKESNFYKILKENEFKVIISHIKDKKDFFEMKVPNCDLIISNPPFSRRNEVFERLWEINKPFAMLVPLVTITKKVVRSHIQDLEMLLFEKRQNFFNSAGKKQGSPYDTIFLCYKLLPKQIILSDYLGTGE